MVSPTHALSIHDIKIKSYGLVLELFWFQKWHVFAHFCIILPIAARAEFELWRARTALSKVKSDCKQMEIVNYDERNSNHVKILNFDVSARCMRAQRARGHVRTENFEML